MLSRGSIPPLTPIERLRCPVCGTRMMLVQISPGPSGFDYRTFECGKCDHADKIMVISDPMKSDSINRLTDGLKPPR